MTGVEGAKIAIRCMALALSLIYLAIAGKDYKDGKTDDLIWCMGIAIILAIMAMS